MVSSGEFPVVDQDEDLKRRVLDYLLGHKLPTLQAIEVESASGDVTLRGKVSSFYQRQLCINCCRRVAGVLRLIDEIQVVPNG